MARQSATGWATSALLVLGFVCGLGCTGLRPQTRYEYFSPPMDADAWSAKISGWQRRELADTGEVAAPPGVALVDGPSLHAVGDGAAEVPTALPLRSKYFNFRAEHKRRMASELAQWIQDEAKLHYVPDGPIDHWATLEETLANNGDDCDGLELLVYHALRDLGFHANEVYRAIVVRSSDGQHHMVTLWFEDAEDPWVIDPTGAMTRGMPRMSEVPGWAPLKLFSDRAEFSVRRVPTGSPDSRSLAVNAPESHE